MGGRVNSRWLQAPATTGRRRILASLGSSGSISRNSSHAVSKAWGQEHKTLGQRSPVTKVPIILQSYSCSRQRYLWKAAPRSAGRRWFLILWRAPHAVGGTYGFRSARNVCSRLQFVQTNISLCFPKLRTAGSMSLSRSSPPHMQTTRGPAEGSQSGPMSAMGHSEKSALKLGMSAIPIGADIKGH